MFFKSSCRNNNNNFLLLLISILETHVKTRILIHFRTIVFSNVNFYFTIKQDHVLLNMLLNK